ncbi:hypothetical protein [Blastococcus saxobsidens]|uniref:Site-specific recombinase XerD n=1 Tax=Blastococcus saxobsidens (strain DD2) TaxID=1146883 RepID=H6RJQ1_BLASD|nr:hypothetical protein [Blastococcus saxobsidens]CCG02356.1 conserved protein of unknown function [Blastococcus saxobsidens DD2]CCG02756.1 conserved protein of unknown function [Blastococcus saxobsidens DD2]CCG03830.1 conserved protein of unknown function [Blastococcus saxobsidens DD2]CCG05228.1 conserved protein of unknown function [Blastococcus saxobsidens DD2]
MSAPRGWSTTTCGQCGELRPCHRKILEQRVCQRCMLRFRRTAKPCPGCGQLKVLAFYDPQRRPACAGCTGHEPVYACPSCGREDSPFGRHCGPCTLRQQLTELLTDPTGDIHPKLQPVFDALMAGPRPQTTLYWLTRASARPDILRDMARGELEISHAAFAALPATRSVDYVRDLLAALGVLPPYQLAVERIVPWLRELLTDLPKPHAEVIDRFARWQLLRRLRLLGERDRVTRGGVQHARAAVLGAARFLRWLDEHNATLATATQAQLDDYLVSHPGRGRSLKVFLDWTQRSGVGSDLHVPGAERPLPQVTLSDQRRWQQVERLLHDDDIRLYVRIGGLFMLLFAQPLARICRMRADQITTEPDGAVTVTFDAAPIQLPDPLDRLVLDQLARRGQASYASRPDRWLFPGGLPGKHLVTENIRSQLVALGIRPSAARKAAMFDLAARMPVPILAELLGLSTNTATRWAALAARDWSQYAAMRRA